MFFLFWRTIFIILFLFPLSLFADLPSVHLKIKDEHYQKVRLAAKPVNIDQYTVEKSDKREKKTGVKQEIDVVVDQTIDETYIMSEDWMLEMQKVIEANTGMLFNKSGEMNGLTGEQLKGYKKRSIPFFTFPNADYVDNDNTAEPVAFWHEGNDRYAVEYLRVRQVGGSSVNELLLVKFYVGSKKTGEAVSYHFVTNDQNKAVEVKVKNAPMGVPVVKDLTGIEWRAK